MKLESILGGLRTALDSPWFAFSTASVVVPLYNGMDPEPGYVIGLAGVSLFELGRHMLAYWDIGVRVGNNHWDERLVNDRAYRENLVWFVRRHPEHQTRYEQLERELFPNRTRD